MSTRCNVVVKRGDEIQQLYHHSDGYPTNLLDRILDGKKIGLAQPAWAAGDPNPTRGVQPWQLGRVGKVASFLCAADPGQFEPEEPGLHWDIEYFYELDLITERLVTERNTVTPTSHTVQLDIPEWMVTVYIPANKKFLDDSTRKNLKRIAGPLRIEDAVKQADSIECGENLERCHHYAHRHFPELDGGPMVKLSTATYLGRQPLEFRDALAVIVRGVRYELTGSGWSGNFGEPGTPGAWTSIVKGLEGNELKIPVAYLGIPMRPYKGVAWVYPPTKDNPNETLVSA